MHLNFRQRLIHLITSVVSSVTFLKLVVVASLTMPRSHEECYHGSATTVGLDSACGAFMVQWHAPMACHSSEAALTFRATVGAADKHRYILHSMNRITDNMYKVNPVSEHPIQLRALCQRYSIKVSVHCFMHDTCLQLSSKSMCKSDAKLPKRATHKHVLKRMKIYFNPTLVMVFVDIAGPVCRREREGRLQQCAERKSTRPRQVKQQCWPESSVCVEISWLTFI